MSYLDELKEQFPVGALVTEQGEEDRAYWIVVEHETNSGSNMARCRLVACDDDYRYFQTNSRFSLYRLARPNPLLVLAHMATWKQVSRHFTFAASAVEACPQEEPSRG